MAFFIGSFSLVHAEGGLTESAEWAAFKTRFITAEGRVVDRGNKDISHTEGQGYGMLFAVAYDDQATFRLIWQWTQDHLTRRPDGLFPWRWTPDAPGARNGQVTDPNNATDGDILIAWALARADERWGDSSFRTQSADLANAILGAAVRHIGSLTVLLPGADGFEHEDKIVLNLSYWIFPAFSALDAVAPSPVWSDLRSSGRELIKAARFGASHLPPDWLQLSIADLPERPLAARVMPADGFPATFSFDAIRVPLYLAWGGFTARDDLGVFEALWSRYEKTSAIPAGIDLTTGVVFPYPLSRGGQDIVAFVEQTNGDPSNMPADAEPLPSNDYYAAALVLLTHVAQAHRSGIHSPE